MSAKDMPIDVLYVTNLANHYQLSFGNGLVGALGGDSVRFAATSPMRADRVAMGWSAESARALPWVILPFEGADALAEYDRWWSDADVVICGVLDLDRIERRTSAGSLTFYMGERWLRTGFTGGASRWVPQGLLRSILGRYAGRTRLLAPQFARRALRMRRISRRSMMHLLPMGHYAAADMAFIGAFPSRVWNWGYFAAGPSNIVPALSGDEVRILWAGRMLDWKRVDTLVQAVAVLARSGVRCSLDLIGHGPELPRLREQVRREGLEHAVSFEGAIPAAEVRTRMRRSGIYVLPSSETEGWGVVINEAMAEGCAVVASRQAGASCVLLEHGRNGMLFNSGDVPALAETLERLIRDPELRLRLGQAASETMRTLWSPEIGAQRLVTLCHGLLGQSAVPDYRSGPCARIR